MVSRRRIFLITIAVLLLTAGCTGKANTDNARVKVSAAQVKEFQNQKTQNRVDIYIPIKEQYATSRHSQSLKDLLSRKSEVKPACFQCMSADYNLAPPDQKPEPQNAKLSITCAVCHVLTVSEFKLRLSPLETCTSCHTNGSEIVPGAVVHHSQKEMFLGYGAIGVPRTPDTKYRSGLTCIECHMPNEAHTFQGKTPKEALQEHTESICVMCHADQSEEEFAKEVDKMQSQIKTECDELEKGLALAREKIDQDNQKRIDTKVARQVYNVVFTNLSFITADKSMGIHNFEYTTKILKYTKMRELELHNQLGL